MSISIPRTGFFKLTNSAQQPPCRQLRFQAILLSLCVALLYTSTAAADGMSAEEWQEISNTEAIELSQAPIEEQRAQFSTTDIEAQGAEIGPREETTQEPQSLEEKEKWLFELEQKALTKLLRKTKMP